MYNADDYCKNDIDVFCDPTGSMHVSLAEALQVRGGPLQEEEVWAVLNQSAESLHELLRRGKPLSWLGPQ